MSRFDWQAEDRKKERERKKKRAAEEETPTSLARYRSQAFADIIRIHGNRTERARKGRVKKTLKIKLIRQAGMKKERYRLAKPLKLTGRLFTEDKSLDMPGNMYLNPKFLRLPKNAPLDNLFKKLDDFDTAMEPMDKGFAARDALKEIERVFNVHEPSESEKKFYKDRAEKDADLKRMQTEGTLMDKFMLKLKALVIAIQNNPYDKKINAALSDFSKDFKEWWNARR